MNDNNNVNSTLTSLADSLSAETGIDSASAVKVISWLLREGALDMPVIVENVNEVA